MVTGGPWDVGRIHQSVGEQGEYVTDGPPYLIVWHAQGWQGVDRREVGRTDLDPVQASTRVNALAAAYRVLREHAATRGRYRLTVHRLWGSLVIDDEVIWHGDDHGREPPL